ncbi:L-threonate dehydrogenase [Bienertia sinuspersici]
MYMTGLGVGGLGKGSVLVVGVGSKGGFVFSRRGVCGVSWAFLVVLTGLCVAALVGLKGVEVIPRIGDQIAEIERRDDFRELDSLSNPQKLLTRVDVLVVMVTNEAQAESVLFGDLGAVQALSAGAAIILSSTVSPAYVNQLEQRLLGQNLNLVDAPVSGGVKKASSGTLTVMASGTNDALEQCVSVLSALSEKLYIIKGGCGAGSCVKMVNQLLAGVHIVSTAEALAFGARLGLHTRKLFEVITNTSGTSWMLENRGPHMVDNDFTPYSALNIFVKDLGIVSHECSSRKVPLHVAVMAHQLFLAGSAAGWGVLDDAAVVKFYESLTGVTVEGRLPVLSKEQKMKSLPPEWPQDLTTDIINLCENNVKPLVVLDDDPTGTQTVHDIEVLTEWNVGALVDQFKKKPKCFFILTNSRALSSEKATALVVEICCNLQTAAKSTDTEFTVETDAVVSVLGDIDACIICPFFLQGGRFTIGDIHYVAEADSLLPAGDTEFAKDSAFGYRSSNLREWVEEKTEGRIVASSVASVSIELLRKGGPNAVCEHLCSLEKGSTCIINSASESDMSVFAAGMILAELKGKRFLCRTAASFVSARIGIASRPPISPKDLGIHKEINGGLIIVGSYVPKTTRQVEELKAQLGHALRWIEISVDKVAMKSSEDRETEINQAAELADISLRTWMDTVVMTSRELISGTTASESLEINFKVSSALVEIVRRINSRPRYILAKGGITSSDIATKALNTKLAKIVGQALAGVPLWQLGSDSRHPGVPYIVFPGNVGDHTALAEVVKSWARPAKLSSAKELLLDAEKGGYAVGAFNVYNLEGIASVVAAAEEEHSPAILQIHPAALKEGGIPLVACCLSAAEHASVPLTVHFDHGTSKQELLEMLERGFDSVMVDGSHLPLEENILYTKCVVHFAHQKDICVEAELGRLSGAEDDLTVEEYEARLTDIDEAEEFIDKTGIDALAVCIGNVHGKYPATGPNLKLDLLKDLHALASRKGVILVLHGASGLPKELIKNAVFSSSYHYILLNEQNCIEHGVRKFNVNTEVRKAFMDSLTKPGKDLVNVMTSAKDAMKAVVAEKMRLFGSSGKAL